MILNLYEYILGLGLITIDCHKEAFFFFSKLYFSGTKQFSEIAQHEEYGENMIGIDT